jgi:primosomal protein N' (replication factor Y)
LVNQTVLKVAINVPLSRIFDYLPPADGPMPAVGCRVLVPFGTRRRTGVVVEVASDSELPRGQIRRSISLLDDEPILATEDLWLLRFTSDYYHHPLGEVVSAALPALLRQGRPLYPVVPVIAATDAGADTDVEGLARRAPRQAELLETVLDAGGNGLDAETLTELMPAWRRVAKALFEKGLISQFEARHEDDEEALLTGGTPGPSLNTQQREAVAAVESSRGFGTFVLDGVTGSGKTEVYLQLMQDVLRRDRQVLILVPEIGLTPQLVERLETRLGIRPAVLHSGLTDLERLRAWRMARSEAAKLVVGTRSAIFTPLPQAGLIVVDEEHDPSLKQQEGLRYSARDLAIARASHAGIPIVLGSATPTLELLHHCRQGRYTHLRLAHRAGDAKPPRLRLVDLNRAATVDGLSPALVAAVESHLAAKGQALIFLNRRGFAPTLICTACGSVAECRRCDSRMTVHSRDRQLRCHHCGASRSLDDACGDCGAPLRTLGEGTQRLEQALGERFPNANVKRIDSDSTQRKGAMDAALTMAEQGHADILVGTQMLSKGHHFPKLTLVGVVNADQGLFSADFRASERLAQSIVQVAGRAGREDREGEVIIQTAFPEHPFWGCLMHGGYEEVAAEALAEREKTRWPPFTRLALIRAAAHRAADAHGFLEAARLKILDFEPSRLRVLGPVDAPMARRAGRYRAQLLLQSADRRALHRVLGALRPALEQFPAARKVRWSIDVDPIELF